MKKYLLIITVLFTAIAVKAQNPTNAANADSTVIDMKADPSVIAPVFPGGTDGWNSFLRHTIRYPAIARENNEQGQVQVHFVVEKDGSLSNLAVLKSPSGELSGESLRVLALSPKWQPATKNGEPVRVSFVAPINYTLTQSTQHNLTPGSVH